ncbi:MAG: GGDEF domain-containing phosphodiesterase [Gammaproteobacteria bacterium]|nr:GGDEF domain-containing phosphodiesterase [Gammaproteobacteria bacterium]
MGHKPEDISATHFRYSLLLREIDHIRRGDNAATVALLLIRLSGLDAVNARFGYLGGDKALEAFAARLRSIARAQDIVFQVDARTFALLLHNPLHEGHALLAADKVARAALEPVAISAGRACMKARIGISVLPEPAHGGEELLRQCEAALGVARRRDEPHVLYSTAFEETCAPALRHAWFDMEEALRAGEFTVHYQPKIALATGRLAGAEALVRWDKPGTGVIPPGHFMAAIENSRGIRALTQFVLNSALREAAGWATRHDGFNVAVNLAAGNLDDPDLVDLVEDALSVWNLPAGQLTLELTETSLMQNPVASARVLKRLRQLGIRMSIDDFGTGYSSLAYLRDLPADELKVDRAFISRILQSARDRDIVASIVRLGHAVDLEVVAEGIEDAETVAAVAAMGCDTGQGYHFAAPLPAGDFEAAWIGPAAGKSAVSRCGVLQMP